MYYASNIIEFERCEKPEGSEVIDENSDEKEM